jgi:murein L,D-transpeptidase YcbB/YkuD
MGKAICPIFVSGESASDVTILSAVCLPCRHIFAGMRVALVCLTALACDDTESSSISSSGTTESLSSAHYIHATLLGDRHEGLDLVPRPQLANHGLVLRFYELRGFEPVWTDPTALPPQNGAASHRSLSLQAALLVAALADAADHGLDPSHYGVSRFLVPPDPEDLAAVGHFDIALTDALMSYALDLRNGRFRAEQIYDKISLPAQDFDPSLALHQIFEPVVSSPQEKIEKLGQWLAALAPLHTQYRLLKQALVVWRVRAAQSTAVPPPPRGVEALKKLTPDARAWLIARLKLENEDFAEPLSDADLREVLKRFQAAHFLKPDGIIGLATFDALAKTPADRVEQIIANLERLRWLPRELGPRHVTVNVPAAELELREADEVVLTSRVIIGTEKNPTPIFSAQIVAITVNPPWTLPHSIARKETLPHLQNDPGYLQKHNMIILGRPDDPYGFGIDWRAYSAAHFPFKLQQSPGAHNSLGRLKLETPNRFAVFLHDTPSRHLFAREGRLFSHGCIRVQDIAELSSYLLTQDRAAALPKLNQAITEGTTRRLDLPTAIPVYIVYETARAGETGETVFFPDIYERDKQLIAALKTGVKVQSTGAALPSQKNAPVIIPASGM